MNGPRTHQLLGAYLLGGLRRTSPRPSNGIWPNAGTAAPNSMNLPASRAAGRVPVSDAVALGAAAAAGGSRRRRIPPRRCRAAAARRLSSRRRAIRRRWTAALAAAAAACLALGILAAPLVNQPPQPDGQLLRPGRDGLQFTVSLVKKSWGTELAVEGRSLPVDGTLSLWGEGRRRRRRPRLRLDGNGERKARVTGATPLQLANIARIEMRNGQQTMAVIAVPRGRARSRGPAPTSGRAGPGRP